MQERHERVQEMQKLSIKKIDNDYYGVYLDGERITVTSSERKALEDAQWYAKYLNQENLAPFRVINSTENFN